MFIRNITLLFLLEFIKVICFLFGIENLSAATSSHKDTFSNYSGKSLYFTVGAPCFNLGGDISWSVIVRLLNVFGRFLEAAEGDCDHLETLLKEDFINTLSGGDVFKALFICQDTLRSTFCQHTPRRWFHQDTLERRFPRDTCIWSRPLGWPCSLWERTGQNHLHQAWLPLYSLPHFGNGHSTYWQNAHSCRPNMQLL